jgi:hypothetical protein
MNKSKLQSFKKFTEDFYNSFGDIEIFHQPSTKEFNELLRNFSIVRFICSSHDLYIWDGRKTHYVVTPQISRPTGDYLYADISKWGSGSLVLNSDTSNAQGKSIISQYNKYLANNNLFWRMLPSGAAIVVDGYMVTKGMQI